MQSIAIELTSGTGHETKDESFVLSGKIWALFEHLLLGYLELLTLCALGEIQVSGVARVQ